MAAYQCLNCGKIEQPGPACCWAPDLFCINDMAREIRRLRGFEAAFREWDTKTQWVQDTSTHRELGMHRADVLRKRITELEAKLSTAPAAQPRTDVVRKALDRAFVMGQNYWADADSESYSANKRSDVTRQKFNAMRDEVCAQMDGIKEQP